MLDMPLDHITMSSDMVFVKNNDEFFEYVFSKKDSRQPDQSNKFLDYAPYSTRV